MKPFETYSLFIALRNHFTKDSYDFFKYNKKTKVSASSFNARNDIYQYQKLGKKYLSETALTNFIVANMISDKTWISEMVITDAMKCEENYLRYQRYMESLTYEFQKEVDVLLSKVNRPQDLFTSKDDDYPPILTEYLAGRIMLPTLVILNDFVEFSKKFDQKYGLDDVMWGKAGFMLKKLKPFIKYDREKIKAILFEKLLNTEKEKKENSNGYDSQ